MSRKQVDVTMCVCLSIRLFACLFMLELDELSLSTDFDDLWGRSLMASEFFVGFVEPPPSVFIRMCEFGSEVRWVVGIKQSLTVILVSIRFDHVFILFELLLLIVFVAIIEWNNNLPIVSFRSWNLILLSVFTNNITGINVANRFLFKQQFPLFLQWRIYLKLKDLSAQFAVSGINKNLPSEIYYSLLNPYKWPFS